MTGPSRPVTPTSHGRGVVFQTGQVTSVDGDIAWVQTQLTQRIKVRTDIMRAKGIKPQVGETWLLESIFDKWIFSVLLVAVEGSMLLPIANVDGLAEALNDIANDIAGNTSGISANTAAITSLQNSVYNLNLWAWRYQDHESDVYDDKVIFESRRFATGARTLSNANGFFTRTHIRRAVAPTVIKVNVTSGGSGGGTTTGAIYVSSTEAGPYIRVASGTHPLSTLGRHNIAVNPVTTLEMGAYVLVLLAPAGYSVGPQISAASAPSVPLGILNPSDIPIVWGGASTLSPAPATIDLSTPGLTPQTGPWWVALG